MRRLSILFSTAVMAYASGVPAQDKFVLPQGCEAFVTIQMKGCEVAHHYICEGDAPGDQWRVDIGPNGPVFMSRIDSETQWLESIELFPTERDMLEPGAKDPASFTELATTGYDSFDFSTMGDDGVRRNVKGFDRLTGKTIIIDEEPLLQTEYYARITRDDGSLMSESRGNEYISLKWRMFLSGKSWIKRPNEEFFSDSSPLEFIYPGEDGFLATRPKYECDSLMS
jgi:hypothetical protein